MRKFGAIAGVLCAAATATAQPDCVERDLAEVPGVVISHERTHNPFLRYFTGRYVGSPTLAVLDDGRYVAAHDLFRRGGGGTEDGDGITRVFRSDDRGASWERVAELDRAFWSTLFSHRGALYLFGYTGQGGHTVIRRSDDGGETWTEPTDAQHGLLREGGGGTPNAPVVHDGRIWIASGTRAWSAPVDADLLDARSWIRSRAQAQDESWLGGEFTFWSEGQIVASPRTGVLILPKIRDRPQTALLSFTRPQGPPVFDPANDFARLPGAEKKFAVRYDPVSDRFYALTNPVLPRDADAAHVYHYGPMRNRRERRVPIAPNLIRNAAAIYSSDDLRTWTREQVFLYSEDVEHVAFQYLNFLIDGDDLIVVARTAWQVGFWDTPRGHDSNLMTFHRVPDFRNPPSDSLAPALADDDRATPGLRGALRRAGR